MSVAEQIKHDRMPHKVKEVVANVEAQGVVEGLAEGGAVHDDASAAFASPAHHMAHAS